MGNIAIAKKSLTELYNEYTKKRKNLPNLLIVSSKEARRNRKNFETVFYNNKVIDG